MLVACITARAMRLGPSADLPVPRDRTTLGRALAAFGAQLLLEVSDPTVVAVFRLAIAEAERTPEIARALDSIGRETGRAALRRMLTRARRSGLLAGDPIALAEEFMALLSGNLMISLLLRVAGPPSPDEARRRADAATSAFFRLHPKSRLP